MTPSPFLGVLYHWAGGLAAASFYIPYRAVRRWSWETYWLVGGIFSWLVAPWTMALLLVPDARAAIQATPARSLMLGVCVRRIVGPRRTHVRPGGSLSRRSHSVSRSRWGCATRSARSCRRSSAANSATSLTSRSGQVILLGVVASLAGIAVCGAAGVVEGE